MTPDNARIRLNGAITALATPFSEGKVDFPGLTRLVRWQIAQGINGLVPCGTTGEAPTLSWEERLDIIGLCVKIAGGRIPIIAGTGTNNTEATVSFTMAAQSLGADAALHVTPYYNRPSQEGLFRHFEAIARKVRSCRSSSTMFRRERRVDLLTRHDRTPRRDFPTIVGIKDATGNLSRPPAISALLGDRFLQLSGHNSTSFGFNTMGGRGTISVVANVAPRLCVDMHDALRRGDHSAARAVHQRLRPLMAALDLDTNPVPVKCALIFCSGSIRMFACRWSSCCRKPRSWFAGRCSRLPDTTTKRPGWPPQGES